MVLFFFFQAEDGIRDIGVTGVQTCALPISTGDWARLDPMPQGVGGAKTAVSRGEIVLTAGGDDRAWQEGKGWVTPSIWRWRPPNGPWRRLPDLQQARHGHETVIGAG